MATREQQNTNCTMKLMKDCGCLLPAQAGMTKKEKKNFVLFMCFMAMNG